jgi:hypothetical protein
MFLSVPAWAVMQTHSASRYYIGVPLQQHKRAQKFAPSLHTLRHCQLVEGDHSSHMRGLQ